MIRHQPIRNALLLAGLYLLTAFVLDALRQREVLSAEVVQRSMGILMGLGLVISANRIPKRLVPLARLWCDPAREQTLRRWGARALLLGGLGYTLAFALAPIAVAGSLAVGLLAPAVLAVAGVTARCAWMRRRARAQSG